MKTFIWIVIIVIIIAGITLASGWQTNNGSEQAGTADTNANAPAVVEKPAPANPPSALTPASAPAAPKTVTVTYSDSGFGPASVNINVGDTIKFLNQSSGMMWVASNPHPEHTNYLGFDEETSVSPDGNYPFTFSKKGTWGYHNHKSPSKIGNVVVQ